MTDWSAFWIGLGFAGGCYFLATGIESLGEQVSLAVKEWWKQRYLYWGRNDDGDEG